MNHVRPRSGASTSGTQAPVVVLAFAALIICAGVAWLTQADALAATGRRIYHLQARRADLMELRSEALVALAAATDPGTREARARSLGFAPPEAIEYVAVPAGPDDGRAVATRWADALSLLSRLAAPTGEPTGHAAHLFTVGTLPADGSERR
jgi:hypothetical protein